MIHIHTFLYLIFCLFIHSTVEGIYLHQGNRDGFQGRVINFQFVDFNNRMYSMGADLHYNYPHSYEVGLKARSIEEKIKDVEDSLSPKRKKSNSKNVNNGINTKAVQGKALDEMKRIIEETFTDEECSQFFVQIIGHYEETVESPVTLKSVNWVQSKLNKYLTGPQSSLKKDSQALLESYITDSSARPESYQEEFVTENSTYIADFIEYSKDLIMALVQTRNADQLIRGRFERIRSFLATSQSTTSLE